MRSCSVLAALGLASASCSLALEPGHQCDTAEDCAGRGFVGAVCEEHFCKAAAAPGGEPWACLGHVTKPQTDPSKTLSMSFTLTYLDRTPVKQATVDVCDKLDIECTGVDARYPKGLHPAASGDVALTVPQGFDGFFRIDGAGIMASRLYVGQPLVTPPNIKALQLIKKADFQTIVAYTKLTVDPTRGTAILFVEDCNLHSASGASFTCAGADATSHVFYLVNQLPVLPPKATSTDVYGMGGFLNLPVGATVAQARLEATGEPIAQVGFGVFSDTVSYVLITPGPQ